MIAEIAPSGASFAGALAYALNLKDEDKKLLREELARKFSAVSPTPDDPGWKEGERHRIIGGNVSGEIEPELKREFAAVRALRPNIKNPLISLSVRKAPGDSVSLQTWEEIAERVVESLGLKGCPFMVIQHRDRDDHIHIIGSRIRLDGKAISDSKSYHKVEKVMREVEIEYGFEPVQESRETYDRASTWWEHKLVQEKGRLSPKLEMQARISAALEDRPTATQFISRLSDAHGIDAIFKTGEDGVPCGVTFKYGDTVMSGGALGRGYTWKKLQERGLTYDERDIEAIERAREGARQGRQQMANQERTVDRTPHTISNARESAVHDPSSNAAIRGEIVDPDGREAESQQYSDGRSAPGGDQPSNQAGLPKTQANIASGGEDQPVRCDIAASEPLVEIPTTPCGSPDAINANPNLLGNAATNPIPDYNHMGLSPAVTGGSGASELVGTVAQSHAMDNYNGGRIWRADADDLENLATSNASDLLASFRDELRGAISDVDDYMQDYWQEEEQCQASITINPTELSETSVEVETEAEEVIVEILELI